MSSKPSTEGVQELRTTLRDYRALAVRIRELKKAAEELPGLEEAAGTLHRRIIQMLEQMDVDSRGNYGWESRMVWFLNELVNQEDTA